jgi:hypothetical protein
MEAEKAGNLLCCGGGRKDRHPRDVTLKEAPRATEKKVRKGELGL